MTQSSSFSGSETFHTKAQADWRALSATGFRALPPHGFAISPPRSALLPGHLTATGARPARSTAHSACESQEAPLPGPAEDRGCREKCEPSSPGQGHPPALPFRGSSRREAGPESVQVAGARCGVRSVTSLGALVFCFLQDSPNRSLVQTPEFHFENGGGLPVCESSDPGVGPMGCT